MTVEGAEVMNAEVLKERWRLPHVADSGFGRVDGSFEVVTNPWDVLGDLFHLGLAAHVERIGSNFDQRVGEEGDGRCVRASVVIQDDRDVALRVPEVIDPFVGHAAGERAVADDRDDAAARTVLGCLGGCEAVGITEDRRSVAVLLSLIHI